MSDPNATDFDFDRWAALAKSDPQAFEDERQRAIAEVLAGAPPEMRQRLRGLQWRIDKVREQSRTPLQACLRISNMMWESTVGENGLVSALEALTHAGERHVRERREPAPVVPLRRPEPPQA